MSGPSSSATRARAEVDASTVWGWLLMLLPFGLVAVLFAGDVEGFYIARDLDGFRGQSTNPIPGIAETAARLEWVAIAIPIALIVASLILAALDARVLRSRGIPGFIPWPLAVITPAYLAGRLFALRRVGVRRNAGLLSVFLVAVLLATLAFAVCAFAIMLRTPSDESWYMNSELD